MITAEVVCDSLHYTRQSRLTTMRLTFPRYLLPEFNTHRAFSRNAASSRAIPTKRFRRMVLDDTAEPVWGGNNPGMQSNTALSPWRIRAAHYAWRGSMYAACAAHWLLEKLGVHKQSANRLLDPYFFVTMVVTGTDEAWSNFLALRDHEAAEPNIAELARAVRVAYSKSAPKELCLGDWHMPFTDNTITGSGWLKKKLVSSVARCARVSYGSTEAGEDELKLYNRLVGSDPKHASPTEHQAVVVPPGNKDGGNFGPTGWAQYRHQIPNESNRTLLKPFLSGTVAE